MYSRNKELKGLKNIKGLLNFQVEPNLRNNMLYTARLRVILYININFLNPSSNNYIQIF